MGDPFYAIREKKMVHTVLFPESRNLFLLVEEAVNKMFRSSVPAEEDSLVNS